MVTKRRSATVDTGSRSSGGPVSGAISRVANRWVPTPTRTWQKSWSVGRRSHMRRVPATSTEGARVGMTPLQRGPLSVTGAFGVVAQASQVAEEVLAFLVEFGRRLARLGATAHEHAGHGHDHHHREDQKRRVAGEVAATHRDHQRDHPDDRDEHHDRHQFHQQIAGNDARHLRW